MSDVQRPAFGLLLQGVAEAEAARIARFLSLGQERLAHPWKIVSDGDVQAVIVDGLELDTIFGMVEPPLATLHLIDAGDPRFAGPDSPLSPDQCLTRPVQYEALLDALREVERIWQAVHQPGAMSAEPAAGAGSRGAARAPLPMRPMPPIPGPGGTSTSPAAPVAVPHAGRPRTFALDPRSTFRLRRWPPTELLLGDRDRFRLATFLSSRGVDLGQLERLSNVPRDKCLDFLARMAAAELLSIKPAAPDLSGALPADGPQVSAPPSARPKVDAGLLGRLRRRLGIGWG
jgi:hypothetical protein